MTRTPPSSPRTCPFVPRSTLFRSELVPACAAQCTWPNRREGEEAQCKAGDRASIVFLGRNDHLPQGDKVGDGGLAAFAEGLQNGAKFLRRIALHDPLGDAIDEIGRAHV